MRTVDTLPSPEYVPHGAAEDSHDQQARAAHAMVDSTNRPGDVAYLTSTGLAEGKGIWDRMAAYIQSRNIDLRLLLDGVRPLGPLHDFALPLTPEWGRGLASWRAFGRQLVGRCHPSTYDRGGLPRPEPRGFWTFRT